jgi:hypothetical protein
MKLHQAEVLFNFNKIQGLQNQPGEEFLLGEKKNVFKMSEDFQI